MTVAIPTGVFDILPEDPKESWREAHLWNYLETLVRAHALSYGCHEIRTPIFERTELFVRSVGDSTDIVSKEMYTFEDRGGRSMSLRPEGTASVMRAFIEKNLQTSAINRFFYIGPMFRYERPQSGRYRQHNQFGVEIVGSKQPEVDAELIEMIYSFFVRLGISHLQVYINCLGDTEARKKFRTELIKYLQPRKSALSEDSQRRLETNPLRILDSKDASDKEVIQGGPSILEFLSSDAKDHFERVQKILRYLKIPFEVNDKLVRGIDYYNNTVFEITSGQLGSQNSLVGGGRYDGLLKDLKGPDLPCIGFGCGLERVIQVLLKQKEHIPEKSRPCLYIIPLGEEAYLKSLDISLALRQDLLMCMVDTTGKKLKNALQKADALNAEFVLVLGENELSENKVELKEMKTGEKIGVSLDNLAFFFKMRFVSRRLHTDYTVMQEAVSQVVNSKHPIDCHTQKHFSLLAKQASSLIDVLSQ